MANEVSKKYYIVAEQNQLKCSECPVRDKRNSVQRSDVPRWKQGYITPPHPYFILWNAVTSLGENKVI